MSLLPSIYSHIAGYIQIVLQVAIVLNISKEEWGSRRLFAVVGGIYIPHVIIITRLISNDSLLGQIVWVLFLFCAYRFAFHISTKKSLIMAFLQMIANTFLEYILILLITFLPQSFQNFISGNLHVSRSVVILFYLTIFVITQRLQRHKDNDIRMRIRSLWFIYLVSLYILIDPIILRIEDQWAKVFVDNQSDLLNVVLLIVLFVFNIAYIQKIRKTAIMSQQLEHKEMYSDSLEKSSEALRGFKHDFSNIINTISGYVDLGDLEALTDYMKELNLDILSIKTTNIVNGELKKIPLLYGVMLSKLSVAELRGIAFEVSLQCDVDSKYCSIVDYSRIIGILLDNAIEAASLSVEKSVLFEVANLRGRQCVTILNSCDKPVDIEKIYESGYTTKDDHNGEGLHQVRLLINKYQRRGYDIELQTSFANKEFCQVVKI